MATRSEKVMAMVEEEIKKNPKVKNDELMEKAKKIDKGIAKLDARQFNARYALQAKRRLAPPKRRRAARRGRRAAQQADRNVAVRGVLLDFAGAVAGAEQRAQLVKVLADVDDYVNRVMKAAGAA